MEYPPTSGDRHLTVFLDAGHGGIDPGGVGEDENGNPVYEADETLPVELDTMALLRGKGFTVVVSRTKAETVSRPAPDDVDGGLFTTQGVHDDVAARDVCADKAKANVLLGIYMDAGGSPDNAGCVTGFDSVRPFAAANLRLATDVQNDVLAAMNAQGWGIPNIGVTDDSELGGPGPDHGGRQLRTPAAARAGRAWLLQHAEHHAGRAHRAALHHRSLRGLDRRDLRLTRRSSPAAWPRPLSSTSPAAADSKSGQPPATAPPRRPAEAEPGLSCSTLRFSARSGSGPLLDHEADEVGHVAPHLVERHVAAGRPRRSGIPRGGTTRPSGRRRPR